MENGEYSVVPSNAELKKMFDDLSEQVAHLAFVLGGLQAEHENLKRKLQLSGALNH